MVRANPERPQSETPIDETIFVDSRDPARLEKAADFIERTVVRYHRGEVRGIERIPRGAGLYVGNHNAGMWTPDTYIFGAAVYRARGVADTEVVIYEGAGHAFFNDTRAEAYVQDAARDAWAKTLAHFKKHLG